MSKRQKALLISFVLGILGWNLFALRQYLEERGEFLAAWQSEEMDVTGGAPWQGTGGVHVDQGRKRQGA